MTSKIIGTTQIADVSAMTDDERNQFSSAALVAGIVVVDMFDGKRVVLSASSQDTITRFVAGFPQAVAR